MLDRTKESLATGITRVKWIASFLVERAKAETSIAKVLYRRSKLEIQINDRYRDIGKRVVELREQGETDVFKDDVIQHALGEVKDMKDAVSRDKRESQPAKKQPEQ